MKLQKIFRLIEPLPTLIILGVALPFLVIGIMEARKVHTKVESFSVAPGTVIGNDLIGRTNPEDSTKTNWTYHPVVRFSASQGREVVFTDGVGTYPPDYETGDGVEVLYDPENPQEASIKNWKHLWFGPIWIIAVGSLPILGLVGWIMWRYVKLTKR